MPTTIIKISQLDSIASLTGSDFFPINQSSSIKTYRASLTQLQNLFSTGSFTGSVIGTIVGTGTSPQFVGTSSWAISSSRSISSSYSDFSNSSSYALSSSRSITASYALTSSYVNDLKQSVLPEINDTFSLGSPSKKWKDLYIATSSIYMGDNILSVKTIGGQKRLHINNIKVLTNDDDFVSLNESTRETRFDTSLEITRNLIIGGSQSNTISASQQVLQVDCSNFRNLTIYAVASGVCSFKIISGQTINVIVLQSAPLTNANISFKALVYDPDELQYFETKILYKDGIIPKLSIGQSNAADLFTFIAVKSDVYSPNVNGTVVFATYTQRYIDYNSTSTSDNIVNSQISPTITVQPISTSQTVGNNVTFSVTATGTATISYQWHKNGIPISGATSNTYVLNTITLNNAGTYSVKVSNSVGFTFSNDVVLTVTGTSAPVISIQPINTTTYEGQPFALYVSAFGIPAVSYQWRKNGVNIPNETSYSYSKTNANFDMGGSYNVVVTNAVGSVTSDTVTLTVSVNPNNVVVIPPIAPPPPTSGDSNGLISYRETATYLNKMLSIVAAMKTKPPGVEWILLDSPITSEASVGDLTIITTVSRRFFYYRGDLANINWYPNPPYRIAVTGGPNMQLVVGNTFDGSMLETYINIKKVSPKIIIITGAGGGVRYYNSDWCNMTVNNTPNVPAFIIAKQFGSSIDQVMDVAIFNNYLYILTIPYQTGKVIIKRSALVTTTLDSVNLGYDPEPYSSTNHGPKFLARQAWRDLWTFDGGTQLFTYTTEELSVKNIFKVADGLTPGVTENRLASSVDGIYGLLNATTLDVFNLVINGTNQSALVVKNKYLNKYYRSTDGITWSSFQP